MRATAILRLSCYFGSYHVKKHSLCRFKNPELVLARCVGSSQGSVEKEAFRRKEDLNFPEKTVTVYTCENLYEKWRKNRTFSRIPNSGVFAKISYIDTKEESHRAKTKVQRTVLCIHGIPGNYGVFSHVIKALSQEGVRVIVPTFPGSLFLPGKHKDELFRHSVKEKTEVFKDFLKALEVSELDCIVAHSSAVYPALQLILDSDLKVKCHVLLNTGGHKPTVTMRPYWFVCVVAYLYLNSVGKTIILKTGKFIMQYILRSPIKVDNIDGICLLAVTMVFSEFRKTKDLFRTIAEKKIPTLYCFSEDDKVVEKKLTYEVISLLGASEKNVDFYDKDAVLQKKGEDLSWLQLLSFKEGSHYVFRKHHEICNQKILELLSRIK